MERPTRDEIHVAADTLHDEAESDCQEATGIEMHARSLLPDDQKKAAIDAQALRHHAEICEKVARWLVEEFITLAQPPGAFNEALDNVIEAAGNLSETLKEEGLEVTAERTSSSPKYWPDGYISPDGYPPDGHLGDD